MSDEYGSDFVVLTDDEGNEQEFEHLDTLEYKGETYMAFIPADTDENAESAEVVILKVQIEEDGEDTLVTLDDEETLDAVFAAFMDRMENGDADDEETDEESDDE